jgi:hypothetical protein
MSVNEIRVEGLHKGDRRPVVHRPLRYKVGGYACNKERPRQTQDAFSLSLATSGCLTG